MGEIMRLLTSFLLVLLPIMGMAQNTEPVFVEKVVNNIQIGPLTDNKNLAFGVKNILQELVQENHSLMETIDENTIVLKTEIVFFDILTTKKNISVFHSDETEVVIRIKGTLYKNGKKIKQFLAEESSSEVSTSTLLVNEGGQFNQQSARNAIKKTCETLIKKLL
jgi:hypothetical protein